MQIKTIAAVARNGVIGDHGTIPWNVPADWARFKRITTGHALVMGRATYESIGRPLPGRLTIVVTRDPAWEPPSSADPGTQVRVARSLDEAIDLARQLKGMNTCWIAGGGQVYREAMSHVTGMDISRIPISPEGDTFFPDIRDDEWRRLFVEPGEGFQVDHYAPVVRTERLLLEPVADADAPEWDRLHSDTALYQRHGDDAITDNEVIDQLLDLNIRSWVETGVGYWIARDAHTREPVGLGGIRLRTEGGETFWNLYYRLPEAQQGKGYATEISQAAFRQLAKLDPLAEVRAVVRPGHHESMAVARRLGLYGLGDVVDDRGRPGKVYGAYLPQLLSR